MGGLVCFAKGEFFQSESPLVIKVLEEDSEPKLARVLLPYLCSLLWRRPLLFSVNTFLLKSAIYLS